MTEMSPVEAIFFAAAAKIDAERAAYLAEACAGDAELRQRVERMLAARPHADKFLEMQARLGDPETATFGNAGKSDANPTANFPGKDEHLGAILGGKYKLIEEIGEGGMGSVYMAQQTEPVKRAVAVKVIKAGMDTKMVLARFEAERQALAMMDHPNIARVLDAGTTESGRPYFVMELVKGVPITQFCDERKLTPRQRLELFVPVCQAIQHAHQKGVIHRDIKPSNVLVAMYDDRAVPKVIDFGVAKAAGSALTDKTLMTGFGSIVGTAEYMSPEQANLNNHDIDTRSDVYSLGVLLYELLTGRTPVDSKSLGKAALLEVLRIVREVEAPKPSAKLSTIDTLPSVAANRGTEPAKLSKLMKGELDWVVLKALEKDRTRRYETANGLARDIQRYLAEEVVEARPPSTRYRLQKFMQRNRGQVIAASLLLLALVAGVVGTSVGLYQANLARDSEAQQRQLAETNERTANTEKANAERAAATEKLARQEEEHQRKFAEAIAQFVKDDFLGLTSVEGQARFGGDFGSKGLDGNATLMTLLDRAATKLKARKDLDPRIEAELCWIVGVNYRGAGEAAKGVPFLERAVELRQKAFGPDHISTLFSMNSLGLAYQEAGLWKKALPLQEETHNLQKAKLGLDHPDTIVSMANLASSYHDAGQLNKALPLYEESLKLMKAKLGPININTFKFMINLASGYQAAGQLDKALPLFEETYKLCKATLPPGHLETITSMGNLASCYQVAGQWNKALPLSEETYKLCVAKLGSDHPMTVVSKANLASIYHDAGQYDKALPLLEESLKSMKATLGPDHPKTLTLINNLAACYWRLKQLDKSVPLFEELLPLLEKKLGRTHPDTLRTVANLSVNYKDAGQWDKALPLFEETLKSMKATLGPDDPQTFTFMNNVAAGYWRLKQLDKSVPLFEELLALEEKKLGRTHPNTLGTVANLGVNYKDAGRVEDAIPLLEEAYQASKKFPPLRWIVSQLVDAYAKTGKSTEAMKLIDETVATARKSLPKDSPQLAGMMARLGMSLLEIKAYTEAEPLLRECLAIREKTQPDAWTTFYTQSMLGRALLGQKKYAEAELLLVKGYEGIKAREKTIPPEGNTRIPECLDRLIELYSATNKPDEVKKYQELRTKYPKSKEVAPMPKEKK